METYAPLVTLSLVRMFLYNGSCLLMFIVQVDVKAAFLNRHLGENV